jgi:D-glycero-D-manno-heptose 1,7-bisphosphate phosphatase
MNKAIFLDRDGVLNKELGTYVATVETFEVLPHIISNLKRFIDNGFLLIVITNQGGIAKKLYTKTELLLIHQKLKQHLLVHGVMFTDIYYCPHHPDFAQCLCRKPGSIMLEKALAKYNIDASQSWMIGDTLRDMQAAEAVNVKGLLIESNADWTPQADLIINRLKV